MSDDIQVPPAVEPVAPTTVVANATQALAIKELGETVGKLEARVRNLTIGLVIVGLLTVGSAGFSLVPRFFGPRMMNGQFQGRTFNGQFNGGQQGNTIQTPAQ